MKKCMVGTILAFMLVLCMSVAVFGSQIQPREYAAYAAPVFTIRNALIYDNIEINSARTNARVVLYSGPEVNESTVIMASSQGYINYYVPVSGRYTLTWTDSWGGGWYSY